MKENVHIEKNKNLKKEERALENYKEEKKKQEQSKTKRMKEDGMKTEFPRIFVKKSTKERASDWKKRIE